MSDDCHSVDMSEIPEADDSSSIHSSDLEPYGCLAIPLHSILARREPVLISKENVDTLVQTPEICRKTVQAWAPSIVYVRDEFITYELCQLAMDTHDSAICGIKPHLLTPEQYYKLSLQSVSKNGWNLKFIPPKIQTQELCDASIKSMCGSIRYCRDKFKTYQNCLYAVSRNGGNIEFVPRALIDEQMCWTAVYAQYVCLNLIPKEFLTQDLCTQAVESHGENVRYVPDQFMSSELGMIAIRSPGATSPSSIAGSHIQYIPAKYLTKEIIVESARRWSPTFKCVPKECLNDNIRQAVLEVAPSCKQFME